MMTYYTLATVGYWCSLEACCKTEREEVGEDYILTHTVRFMMLNRFGERCDMGFFILNQYDPDERTIIDQNGETFPTLQAAIEAHVDEFLKIRRLPELRPMAEPMRHRTWQGGEATAF